MAVAYQSITNNGAGGATTFSHTTPVGTNRLLVVAVVWYDAQGSGQPITGITYDGNALTHVVTEDDSGNGAALYYRVAPAEGAANVVVSFGGGGTPEEGPVIFAISFQGVNQSAPTDDSGADDDSSSSPGTVSVTLSSQADGLCVGCVYSYQDATITSGGGQTRRDTHTYNDDTGAVDTEAGAASVAVGFSDAAYPVMVAAALAPAAVTGQPMALRGTTVPHLRQWHVRVS